MNLKSYRDLIAWKMGMELTRKSYQIAQRLPKEELYAMSAQIRRAAVSIPSNIAEGYARAHRKEYIQFLAISRGSLAELQTLLLLAVKLNLIQGDQIKDVFLYSEEVGKVLFRLQGSLYP